MDIREHYVTELPQVVEPSAKYFVLDQTTGTFTVFIISINGEPKAAGYAAGNTTIKSHEWHIGVDKAAGTTIQDNDLVGATLVGPLFIDNSPIMKRASNITFDSLTGTIDFSAIGGLFEGSYLEVVYK